MLKKYLLFNTDMENAEHRLTDCILIVIRLLFGYNNCINHVLDLTSLIVLKWLSLFSKMPYDLLTVARRASVLV